MARVVPCPRCASQVLIEPGQRPQCPSCGYGSAAPAGAPEPVRRSSAPPALTTGAVVGRGIGLFGVLGLSLGLSVLGVMVAFDFFSEDGGLGDALLGGIFLMVGAMFIYLIGAVVAAVLGIHAARVLPGSGAAPIAGLAIGAAGHLVMVLAFFLTIALGVVILSPAQEGAVSGADEGSGETSLTDFTAVFKFLFGLVPAGLSGLAAGTLFRGVNAPLEAEIAGLKRQLGQ